MVYLLDTNILSDMVRNPSGRAASRLRERGEANACTSIIAAAELRYGGERRGSPRLQGAIVGLLANIEVLPFEAPADLVYARLRHRLASAGRPISGNDLLIGAHALALGCTMVTANLREFSRIEGLACENWLD